MSDGYYCAKCGTVQPLGSGRIGCRKCGGLGLRGFANARPVRVPCPVVGCAETVWNDGGVNPVKSQHLWSRHPEPTESVTPGAEG